MQRYGRRSWMLVIPAQFMLAYGGNHFTPLLHMYEELGHYSPWQVNLLLGVYVFGLAPGLLVAASLSNKYGRKPVVIAGLFATMLGSLLIGSALHFYPLLCLGRLVAGVGVGVAMSVGTSWVKELSMAPFDPEAAVSSGAKRPALTMTLGFALGAGVSGTLSQFGPLPHILPYVVHGSLSVVALVIVCFAPESRFVHVARGAVASPPWWRTFHVPGAVQPRFTKLIVPLGPWVFAGAGVAYAIVPASVQVNLGEHTVLYVTFLTMTAMCLGAVAQSFVPRIERATGGRAMQIGLGLMALGMVLAVLATILLSPVFAAFVAVVLGVAYGICVVSGLAHVQGISPPDELAGLTGYYYAITYIGFLLPTVVAALLPIMSYSVSMSVVAALCIFCFFVVVRRRGSGRA